MKRMNTMARRTWFFIITIVVSVGVEKSLALHVSAFVTSPFKEVRVRSRRLQSRNSCTASHHNASINIRNRSKILASNSRWEVDTETDTVTDGIIHMPKNSNQVVHHNMDDNENHMKNGDDGGNNNDLMVPSSRRRALKFMAASVTAITASSSLLSSPEVANAGKYEIDSVSGQLFSPKNEMLGGGGSDMARGITLQSRNRNRSTQSQASKVFAQNEGLLQPIYETRFITYLSRFLLNFDPAARSWWQSQTFNSNGKMSVESQQKLRFAEFAESVEVGLADYFVGAYGSYASVAAAKAGLSAKAPAVSSSKDLEKPKSNFFDSVRDTVKKNDAKQQSANITEEKAIKSAKQGVLNLFALLQARYTAPEEKLQLAILFSFISDPRLQPSKAIQSIIGEADNGSISEIELVGKLSEGDNFRGSSHHGGGYSIIENPEVIVDPPPALGADYKVAQFSVKMKSTTRVLRIRVLDGGAGYTSIPKVDVIQDGVPVENTCDACAILDRDGSVESVILLDPGFGYGKGKTLTPPEVVIAPPKNFRLKKGRKSKNQDNDTYRRAYAVAELEFAIDSIQIEEGGNGYIINQPPNLVVQPPEEDPDWYVSPIDRRAWIPVDRDSLELEVKSMSYQSNGQKIIADVIENERNLIDSVTPSILDEFCKSPIALFPSTLRPHYTGPKQKIKGTEKKAEKYGYYGILSLPDPPPASMILPSPRYRAYDPCFGAIGSKPVTKSAQALTGDEYVRLALSGAICTVLVRTALNPLELVKTKIQLKNDEELMLTINANKQEVVPNNQPTKEGDAVDSESQVDVGTLDVIKAMITMRGPLSLFQSADITFLASVVFGTFGFGATELFRRSFTMVFFPDSSGGGFSVGSEFTLLAAAALACVITSLAAAPFEILRVRSMGYAEPQQVGKVFSDFLAEKRRTRKKPKRGRMTVSTIPHHAQDYTLLDIKKDDIQPLFSGFLPIVSRELPFAVIKFLAFDIVATVIISLINAQPQIIEPIQVGTGTIGLAVSAFAGAIAGLAGAFVSHPADLILTLTSSKKNSDDEGGSSSSGSGDETQKEAGGGADWKPIVQDLLSREGGVLNLFTGLPARSTFFFLVIGLQFFLYDYAKNILQVGSDDLTLVLDVFYAIRQGLQ